MADDRVEEVHEQNAEAINVQYAAIENEELKQKVAELFNHEDTPISVLIEELIRTVAENIHEDITKLCNDYPVSLAFEATMDQTFHIKYGSLYEDK